MFASGTHVLKSEGLLFGTKFKPQKFTNFNPVVLKVGYPV